jgi:hypothetical protein
MANAKTISAKATSAKAANPNPNGKASPRYQSGFGNEFVSEAVAGV